MSDPKALPTDSDTLKSRAYFECITGDFHGPGVKRAALDAAFDVLYARIAELEEELKDRADSEAKITLDLDAEITAREKVEAERDVARESLKMAVLAMKFCSGGSCVNAFNALCESESPAPQGEKT